MPPEKAVITGRCYCGDSRVSATTRPLTVALCHCADCRRITGAPVGAFAAFAKDTVTLTTAMRTPAEINPGTRRWFCTHCGSPLAATYDYLPGQIYVPLGLLDQADDIAPEQHSHADSALKWLHISDDLPRFSASGRDRLNQVSDAE